MNTAVKLAAGLILTIIGIGIEVGVVTVVGILLLLAFLVDAITAYAKDQKHKGESGRQSEALSKEEKDEEEVMRVLERALDAHERATDRLATTLKRTEGLTKNADNKAAGNWDLRF